jgi:acetate kinase
MTGREHARLDEGSILVINTGSSSLKFANYRLRADRKLSLSCHGRIEGTGTSPHFVAQDAAGKVLVERRWGTAEPVRVHDLLEFLMAWLDSRFGAGHLAAVGHRVALGGLEHSDPILLDDAAVDRLRALTPFAPLHQPYNLEPIDALWKVHPALPQVACFDTAFHRTMPPVAQLYGLPRALRKAGARRYGFHGLSYEYIASQLPEVDPQAAAGRTVVAHLGSGASMCALSGSRSVATTMGFSPLSGLVMGTRPGDFDAGILLWLIRERGMSPAAIESMLYRDSGLLGVSGISGDLRVLLASTEARAREAIDLFVYRICRECGSLAAALGGLDALVFTGGIGEHAAQIRAAVCRQCTWLGLVLDDAANQRGEPLISAPSSKVKIWIVPTDEELMIARHTASIVVGHDAATSS